MSLELFHPAVADWFRGALGEPTGAQNQGWPAIQARRHTLIAAPTGSGKTLAAFLAAIDDLIRQGLDGTLPTGTQVVYVSPLKALSNDIQRNLQEPLQGIQDRLLEHGLPPVELRAEVRTGDTPAAARTAMVKKPPHILVTTPESLYILLTSPRGREVLKTVRTVIVDEIHALVGNKRGTHLTLSLERLEALAQQPLVRVGLSATQKPIEQVAHYLVGNRLVGNCASTQGEGPVPDATQPPADCTIVDTGHVRVRDLGLELTASPLESVMSAEAWAEVYDRLAELIRAHKTTLVFVNTRRLAERVARFLSERLGEEAVSSHHGSMSKEHRLAAEQRLKAGELRALVATASLELGIDIGAVDLVCQLSSPKSIAAFLQRVGRSGHSLSGTPKGRLFPLSRDDLVECAALLDAVRRGELDRIWMPEQPLDILAQQIVAAVAGDEWDEDALYALVRRAWPYRHLERKVFDDVLEQTSKGFPSARGRRADYVHRDLVGNRLRARKSARLTAITNGGAIPEMADYDVVLDPEGIQVGTVNEDFAVESIPGDIFQLGNTSWRITRVEPGRVRVEDAQGQPPTIPFWLGEAPGRSDELSLAVSRLREEAAQILERHKADIRAPLPAEVLDAREAGVPVEREGVLLLAEGAGEDGLPLTQFVYEEHPLVVWLRAELGLALEPALQLGDYLAMSHAALGALPTQQTVVLERFFDEAGGMQLVLHSPFGSRINRAWGLSLRKRFCRSFNFELQAAAIEDAIVISLGPVHSFPLEDVFRFLKAGTVRDLLVQALLDAPLFGVRWRHNTNRALAVLRRRGGKKIAPPLQRMQAEDILALVFPDQLACLENVVGDREVPDHPLVQQTIRDCLEEAMDIAGLERLLRRMEEGGLTLLARDLREPSPLAAEILSAKPYAFLDDAPLEERRTQAVMSRRWLDPETANSLGALDLAAIRSVQAEAWPLVASADDLHDALSLQGLLTEAEGEAGSGRFAEEGDAPEQDALEGLRGWRPWLDELSAAGRATVLTPAPGTPRLWVAAEWLPLLRAVYPQATCTPALTLPPRIAPYAGDAEAALVALLRGRMEAAGPVTARQIATDLGLDEPTVQVALARLENEGAVLQGRYTPDAPEQEWCERGLLARIHRYTMSRLRREIEPVSAADYLRFLAQWQRVAPGSATEGIEGLAAVIELLEGFDAPAAAWEGELLPARCVGYDSEALDRLCFSGQVLWARLAASGANGKGANGGGRRLGPVSTTPIALLLRERLPVWRQLSPAQPEDVHLSTPARHLRETLQSRGASFFGDLTEATGLLPTQVEMGLGELVAAGLVTADGFAGLRALLVPSTRRPVLRGRRANPMAGGISAESAGRWALVRTPEPSTLQAVPDAPAPLSAPGVSPEAVEAFARVLLRRYGVVFRKLLEREHRAPPWRDLLRVLRRLEARGELRGGRFVAGFSGEQYALPEAVGKLREVRKQAGTGALLSVSAADPLNLVGIVTPGRRLTSHPANRLLFRDGVPVATLEAGEVQFLVKLDESEQWLLRTALLRGHTPSAAQQPTGWRGRRGGAPVFEAG